MATYFLAAFLFAVGSLGASAHNVAAPVKSVTLRYKFAPGQMRRWKMHTSQSSTLLTGKSAAPMPLNMTTDMVVRQIVKTVRATDGAATSSGEIEDLHVFTNGKETPFPNNSFAQKKSYTIIALPSGKVISFQMSGTPEKEQSNNFTGSNIVLPDRPLKIGDSWRGTATAPQDGTQVTLINTLTGFDHSGGGFQAIIQQKMTGVMKKTITQGVVSPMDLNGKISGSGTYVFDMDAGTISRLACVSTVSMTLTPKLSPGATVGQQPPKAMKMEMQSQVTMTRIEDALPAP